MAPYAFSASDWPSKDEQGRTIHYKPNVSEPPLERGVLISSSRGKPSLHWKKVLDPIQDGYPDILNYVSFFVPKKIDANKHKLVRASLEASFSLAFPDKPPRTVTSWVDTECSTEGVCVAFIIPPSEVRASEIVAAAAYWDWRVEGHPLGAPLFMGFETNEVLQGVTFKKVPDAGKDGLVAALPHFFTHVFCPLQTLKIIDVWEHQSRSSKDDPNWKFKGSITVLLKVCTPFPKDNKLAGIVKQWPGWYHLRDEFLIEIEYAGRFKFCDYCKHSSQDFEGPNRRHTSDECIRLMCGVCGHAGHDAYGEEASEKHKTACEEGRKRRLDEKEKEKQARKRRKTEHESGLSASSDTSTATVVSSVGENAQVQGGSESASGAAEDKGERGSTAQDEDHAKA